MNRTEAVEILSNKTGLSKKACIDTYTILFDLIGDTLAKKEEFRVVGFGTFKPLTRKARTGRNVKTGEPIEIPEKDTVSFKVATNLSDKVNAHRLIVNEPGKKKATGRKKKVA